MGISSRNIFQAIKKKWLEDDVAGDETVRRRRNMEDLISVIVPVYNSEQYLRSCIESVLVQTYSCYEIILIDDGSSDRSVEICQRMCRYDQRLRLICQKHRGVSAARNRGIEEAKGKYIFFLDSDDMIHPWLLGVLYEHIKKSHAVIATEGYQYIKENSSFEKRWDTTNVKKLRSYYLDYKKALLRLSLADHTAMLYAIGGKLVLREALKQIRFHEKLSNGEDTLFIYQLLNQGADVSVLCCKWYGYRVKKLVDIYSPKACQSRYKALKDIRNQEIMNKRISSAVHWEEYIVDGIIQAYITGYECDNKQLVSYAIRMINIERMSSVFSKIGWTRRARLIMAFRYCALYRWVQRYLLGRI